jgi:hypothetical protein
MLHAAQNMSINSTSTNKEHGNIQGYNSAYDYLSYLFDIGLAFENRKLRNIMGLKQRCTEKMAGETKRRWKLVHRSNKKLQNL